MEFSTIIDGYNLMHACGLAPGSQSASDSQKSWLRARRVLVGRISKRMPRESQSKTLIVFDSSLKIDREDPSLNTSPIKVLFAIDHESADAMIIDLIRKHSSPKRLTVVSSDHEIQTVALRRKSIAIDSDDWYFDHLASQGDGRRRPKPQNTVEREPRTQSPEGDITKPTVPDLTDSSEESWVDIFSAEPEAKSEDGQKRSDRSSKNNGVAKGKPKREEGNHSTHSDKDHFDIPDEQYGEASKEIGNEREDVKNWNPFPEDYLDEIDDESDY